jgi:Zn-finger nucleic acid-binding protein
VDRGGAVLECQHCGSADSQPEIIRLIEIGEDSDRRCPVCALALAKGRLEGIPLVICRRCSGMLIDMEHFVTIVEIARAHTKRSDTILPRRQQPGERTLECPRCGNAMLSHLYGGPGNLVIDTCERCYVNWLDAGELRRIAVAP